MKANKIAIKNLSKICSSESTINCRFCHSCIKLTHTTWLLWDCVTAYVTCIFESKETFKLYYVYKNQVFLGLYTLWRENSCLISNLPYSYAKRLYQKEVSEKNKNFCKIYKNHSIVFRYLELRRGFW